MEHYIIFISFDDGNSGYETSERVVVGRENADNYFDKMVEESKEAEQEIEQGNENARYGFIREVHMSNGKIDEHGLIVDDGELRTYVCKEDRDEYEELFDCVTER